MLVGGPLYFFLSPSQITLLKDLLMKLAPKCNDQASTTFISSLGGHPMRSEHFQKITDQIQGDLAWPGRSPPGGFSADPWSGAEQFFDLSLGLKFTFVLSLY